MRLLLLGSSSVESDGAPLVAALRSALGAGVEVLARGRRGWSVRSWLASWASARPVELEALGSSDRVAVYLPGNGVAAPADVSALHALIVSSTRARVAWMLLPYWPPGSQRLEVERNRAAIASSGVPMLGGRVQLEPADLAPDGVHLTAGGGRKVAMAWAPRLRGSSVSPVILALLLFAAWRIVPGIG